MFISETTKKKKKWSAITSPAVPSSGKDPQISSSQSHPACRCLPFLATHCPSSYRRYTGPKAEALHMPAQMEMSAGTSHANWAASTVCMQLGGMQKSAMNGK